MHELAYFDVEQDVCELCWCAVRIEISDIRPFAGKTDCKIEVGNQRPAAEERAVPSMRSCQSPGVEIRWGVYLPIPDIEIPECFPASFFVEFSKVGPLLFQEKMNTLSFFHSFLERISAPLCIPRVGERRHVDQQLLYPEQ